MYETEIINQADSAILMHVSTHVNSYLGGHVHLDCTLCVYLCTCMGVCMAHVAAVADCVSGIVLCCPVTLCR